MCLGALYWARPERVYFAATKHDATRAGFDDSFIYQQMSVPPEERTIAMVHVPDETSKLPFEEWAARAGKIAY
jgi:guanine deaminase